MHIVMTGRDNARTGSACRLLAERSGSKRVEMAIADFSRLDDVRRLARKILAAHDRVDVLVNNAGLLSPEYRLSSDGFELTFAVSHLAPFLLTNLLLDRLKASAPARIVTVASEAHRGNRIDTGGLARPHDWTTTRAYGRSKLCNILFTRELGSRLDPGEVVAACLHPGFVATRIGQRGGLVGREWRLAKPFMLSPAQGAETSVFLAMVPDPKPFHGGYVIRNAVSRPDAAALDGGLARRLWDESSRLVSL